MKKLSKMNLKANAILSGSEMKKVKGGIDCYRSGTNSVFTTDSIRVAGAWMAAWKSLGNDVKCYG